MKILYVRISSVDQNIDRQRINDKDFTYIVEDRCSGAVAFFEREGGKEIFKLVNKKAITSLSVISIDRLGRDLKNILETIEFFSLRGIPINFINQGLTTLDNNGKENMACTLMIGILASVAQMERSQIRERQMEGIQLAKMRGNVFLGRKEGTKEDTLKFLSKPKNAKALEYIKKGYTHNEISKIVGIHINTVTKIKKLGLQDSANSKINPPL